MCGIAGIIAPDGDLEPAHLVSMSEALDHRGPDAAGYLLAGEGRSPSLRVGRTIDGCRPDEGPVTLGLAHRRLSIIDLNTGSDQPFVDEARSLCLIYNGEIYNYVELRDELARAGHSFLTGGDTEVVLKAYAEWGPGCVERFVGMWAFAILDLRRRVLLVSRDRFGIKPLYYTRIGRRVLFASEIKALLSVPGLSRDPHEATASRFLQTGIVDSTDATFFDAVGRLPAATNGTFRLDDPQLRLETERYWRAGDAGSPGDLAVDDAVERVRACLEESILLHARADVEVGTCLSGGIDSSGIVCLAEVLRGQGRVPAYKHAAFGYVPPEQELSEQQYMASVVDQTHARMTYVTPTRQEFFDAVPGIIELQDEPFGSASIAAQWFVFKAAGEAGIKVMLDGQGADEIFAGYHHFLDKIAAALLRNGQARDYIRFVRSYRRLYDRSPFPTGYAAAALAPRPLRVAGAAARRALLRNTGEGRQIAAPFLTSALRDAAEPLDLETTAPDTLEQAIRSQTERVSLPSLLRFEDRNSMAHSIEARVPYLDHRLVDLAFGLPDELKVRKAVPKWVLREALRPFLPGPVLKRRDKIGFRADPAVTWALADQHREALIESRTGPEQDWFVPGELSNLIDHRPRSQAVEFMLWRVINTKIWLRHQLDPGRHPLEAH